MQVRVTTPVKLNLTRSDGSQLISASDIDAPETHFMRLEITHDHFTVKQILTRAATDAKPAGDGLI